MGESWGGMFWSIIESAFRLSKLHSMATGTQVSPCLSAPPHSQFLGPVGSEAELLTSGCGFQES